MKGKFGRLGNGKMAGEGEEGDERVRRSVEGGRRGDLEAVAAETAWR